jgi:hypothetical protein
MTQGAASSGRNNRTTHSRVGEDMASVTTTWTGSAGNRLWSDPGNWTNGVPPSGASFAKGSDDTVTLDNSVATTPFTVTITGAAASATVTVNLTDPGGRAVGPAHRDARAA